MAQNRDNYRGHLPPPFYNAKEEKYDRLQYPAEAGYNSTIHEDRSNYGRGGYYGSTYRQQYYDRERGNRESRGNQDTYRNLGDRRWQDGRRDWWEVERSTRPGYAPLEERFAQSGMHRGKGPRAYRRSDDRIQEDLNDRLYDDPYVDASDVEVNVTNGEIILTGTVEDRAGKRRAEDLAESVSGVKHIENRLRIRQENAGIRESTDRSQLREFPY